MGGDLVKRVALVTGAGSGIGWATAAAFVQQQMLVIGIDRCAESLQRLGQTFPQITTCVCDVTHHVDLERCVQQAVDTHGQIDILVNNAGLCYYERLAESRLEHWRKTVAVNLEAMYVLAQLVVPHMAKRKYGRVVNVSSVQAIASESVVGAYAATKGGVNAWTRSLAVDLAEYGILVNAVAPGCIRTPMSVIDGKDETQSEFFNTWYVKQRKIPLARPGKAEEVADAIAFLASDRCTYITGHTLVVDGGLTITF